MYLFSSLCLWQKRIGNFLNGWIIGNWLWKKLENDQVLLFLIKQAFLMV